MSNTVAGLGAADFLSATQGLLPPGDLLSRDPDVLLTSLLAGLAGRMVDVHAQVGLLTEVESDPRATTLLLPGWERSFGLPDPCLGASPALPQRRAQLVARIAGQGGQDTAYFISYAANLGYAITIDVFAPYKFGKPFGKQVFGPGVAYTWRINAPSITINYFKFGQNKFGDAFAGSNNAVLQCEIARIAPAHAQLVYAFS